MNLILDMLDQRQVRWEENKIKYNLIELYFESDDYWKFIREEFMSVK